ncbi:MAG: 5-methyltetrahydropteroyltriglutamate--homocysteine S-methyltransferase [Bdellovibrionales bacterium]
MSLATNLGFPRLGLRRECKTALESFWQGKTSEESLLKAAQELRARHWTIQKNAGLDHIPSNDFSLYDHVLDMIAMTGAIPDAYRNMQGLTAYFAMARGRQNRMSSGAILDVPALEMTKWFDTNYHYIVPVFEAHQTFSLNSCKPLDEFLEAKALGIVTRPVLLGPVSFLKLGKRRDGKNALDLLPQLLPVYVETLKKLAEAGAPWVQIDEPVLVLDAQTDTEAAIKQAYEAFSKLPNRPKIALTTYFGTVTQNRSYIYNLPVEALHLDLSRAPDQLEPALMAMAKGNTILSMGIVDGRNIWRNDLDRSLDLLRHATSKLGKDRIWVGPSCSLLHSPIDLSAETKLDEELKSWLAFSVQKLDEIVTLAQTLRGNSAESAARGKLQEARMALASRRSSSRTQNPVMRHRLGMIAPEQTRRANPFAIRRQEQARILQLPGLPTTTIGSFPQTQAVRAARAAWKKGQKTTAEYESYLEKEIREAIQWQEEVGLDVLVHGEFERNDMVEYFGELLEGFAFTENGWVQSYGSRGVKPPIIFGDVARKGPMTVRWSSFAQSLTSQPVKGMLTGPVTILQWSFVRDDQPRAQTCRQIALAIRDEVGDLEKAGISVIQIDEPAIREGLPLVTSERAAYLAWAVECFRLASSGVKDGTQIHTHMCYSEFNDIMASIADMDADVISIETARSKLELLDAFVNFKYPNGIGPGVYDIHSPRVPTVDEMIALLERAASLLPMDRLWINPDCGLKTRGWDETKTSLTNMVAAAKTLRELHKLPTTRATLKRPESV